ncbi:MAG: Amino-acid acetyltransferase, mitochondrial [Claussenomyces sp. TS43310]|nr:MAG: Amino-acid acetyltransferase, mitochondrial [Claussenomyces sp. TS43310]
MQVRHLAGKRGGGVAGHSISSHSNVGYDALRAVCFTARSVSTASARSVREENGPNSAESRRAKTGRPGKDRSLDRVMPTAPETEPILMIWQDFFLSILGSSATRREAKSYLQRFTPPRASCDVANAPSQNLGSSTDDAQRHGVNLGTFYGATRAVAESPTFVQHPEMGPINLAMVTTTHVALVKIRAPQQLDDETLNGIGRTLAQLSRLGLTSTVVFDCGKPSGTTGLSDAEEWRSLCSQQATRIVAAIEAHGSSGARRIEHLIGVSEEKTVRPSAAYLRGQTHVTHRKLLMTPLRRGVIPVISPIAYTEQTSRAVIVEADDVILTLTREFAGFHATTLPGDDPEAAAGLLQALRKEVSLDRLIILDPLGGIPTSDRPNGYHLFLNMEQEFETVKSSLLSAHSQAVTSHNIAETDDGVKVSDVASGNPFSKFVETEFGQIQSSQGLTQPLRSEKPGSSPYMSHLRNLQLVQAALSLLPPSSSALLTTPEEAANSGKQSDTPFQAAGVGTRRRRNPLIHNLLTDKPVFSSSLPAGRLGPRNPMANAKSASPSPHTYPTTFAKRGMSVTMLPDPRTNPWKPPGAGVPRVALTDSHIDLPRLVHLIDDSFNRKLDVQSYLKRVNDRIAGIIIAGEYEGGALLTWECPPGVVDDGSAASRARMVPYLDKFAVLSRSQGAGGVADIVFTSMVRDCFPNGVCWRSRRDNPVNKWYFERSRGTWKIPGTNWAMFWTTPELGSNRQMFLDYEGVCRSIEPSWADGKAMVD